MSSIVFDTKFLARFLNLFADLFSYSSFSMLGQFYRLHTFSHGCLCSLLVGMPGVLSFSSRWVHIFCNSLIIFATY